MRTITAAQQAVLASGVQAEYCRLSVKDADGNWRDLTTWPGINLQKSVSWKASVNDPHMTFDAVLARELYQLSLAPLITSSALNRAFGATAYEPLLKINREVKIEVAIVPMDSAPASGDWFEVFRGRIDQVDAARGKDVTLSGRDLGGRLAQQYIKQERVYAFAADTGAMVSLRIWRPEMIVVANEYILPASRGDDDLGFAKFYKVTTGGTTGLTEPAWTGGAGIASGTAVFAFVDSPTLAGFPVQEVIQKILDDNRLTGDPVVTLEVEGDPLWDVTEFMQGRGFSLEATRALATQIGWDLRYKWNATAGEFRYTMYEPERDAPAVLHTFSVEDYAEPTKLAVDISTIRNSVKVIIKDKSDTYPDGTPKRKEIIATAPASITEFEQELWSELQEDENGNIDTEAEGERLAESFIKDCSQPTAEVAIPLTRGFPWVELNDFYAFEADGVHASADLELAATGWSQTFEGGKLATSFDLRGKPTIGHVVHLEKEEHPNRPKKSKPHRLEHFQAPKTVNPTFLPVVGGVHVKYERDRRGGQLLEEFEIHISDAPNFTPDETTLVAVTSGNEITVPYQQPGDTFYGKAIPRWYNTGQLVRGQPSKEQTFTAGQARAQHLLTDVEWGRLPLNGGFETWSGPSEEAPDHWETDGGLVTVRQSGSGGVSGRDWIKYLANLGDIELRTRTPFPIERGVDYEVPWWVRLQTDGSVGEVSLFVRWLDWEQNALNDDLVDAIAALAGVDNNWVRRSGVVTAPDDARFAQIVIVRTVVPDDVFHLHIDSVRFERA